MSWRVTTEQVAIIVPALAAVALSVVTSRLQRKLNQEAQAHQEMMQRDPGTPEEVEARSGSSLPDQWTLVDEIRKDLHGLVRELEESVNTELRS